MASRAAAARRRRHRPSPRHLAVVAAVWIAVAGGALLVARALDSPVDAGARDAARPAGVGQVAEAPAAPAAPPRREAPGEPAAGALPPFAMVLDRPMPDGVAGLDPARQAEELRRRAMASDDPDRLVELGSVMQVLGDPASAGFAYRSALRADPGSLAARVGLAVAGGGAGAGALDRAAGRLQALAADHPGDQLVSFNRAWVEVYRERSPAARALLERTLALGPGTRLGRTSAALLAAMDGVELPRTP